MRPLDAGSGPWTVRFIRTAGAQFGERWSLRAIAPEDALDIVLPPHAGEPCRGDRRPLVGPEGATVRDAARAFAAVQTAYERDNPSCWKRITHAATEPFSPLILTAEPLDHDDYRGLAGEPGRLYHLDGFHRLVGWAWAGRLAGPGFITVLVAGT
jgi:hypothetical protein